MKNLTNKSKTIVYISIAISILLVITTIVLYLSMSNNNTVNKDSIVLIPIIVIIAIVSLAVVIYKRQKRNEYTKDFNKDYYDVYETIEDSINNSNLTRAERNEALSDITSMMYHAQLKNRDIKDVVGDDIDGFINKVKDSFGYRNSILFYILNGVWYLILVLVIMQIVTYLSNQDIIESFFDTMISKTIIPYMVLLSFFLVPIIRYFKAKSKVGWGLAIPVMIIIVYFVLHEVFYYLNLDIDWIANYLHGEVGIITSYWMLFLYAGIFGLCFLVKWYLRYRSIKNL